MEHFDIASILHELNTWKACGGLLILLGFLIIFAKLKQEEMNRVGWILLIGGCLLMVGGVLIWIYFPEEKKLAITETPKKNQDTVYVNNPSRNPSPKKDVPIEKKTHETIDPAPQKEPNPSPDKTTDDTSNSNLFICSGRIVDVDDNSIPIKGALIQFGQFKKITDSNGRFTIEWAFEKPNKHITVHVSHPKYGVEDWSISQGQTNKIITLQKQ